MDLVTQPLQSIVNLRRPGVAKRQPDEIGIARTGRKYVPGCNADVVGDGVVEQEFGVDVLRQLQPEYRAADWFGRSGFGRECFGDDGYHALRIALQYGTQGLQIPVIVAGRQEFAQRELLQEPR